MTDLAPRAAVLLYHRVSDDVRDPWCLNVNPRNFQEQLDVLTERFEVVPLSELAAAIKTNTFRDRSFALTFDDGYADNATVAAPLLERAGVPATVFVTVDAVESKHWFWWDRLESLFLDPGELPELFQIELGGRLHRWKLGAASQYDESAAAADAGWQVGEPPPSMRQSTFAAVASVMRRLGVEAQREACTGLEAWAGRTLPEPPSRRPMTWAEFDGLAATGCFDIGSHTVHHPSLPNLGPLSRAWEIRESRIRLERRLQRPLRAFAYPYGHVDDLTRDAVATEGFEVACTVAETTIAPGQALLELPRFGVENWDGEEFGRWLDELVS